MSFRDDDDDTSKGRMTQGGSRPRRGHTIWWALPAAVIILAIVIVMTTLPRKHSKAEQGTVPVSSGMKTTAPGGVAPGALPATSAPPAAPAIKP